MSDIRTAKAELRRLALARRDALDPQTRRTASLRAAERLQPLLRAGETVALFWPMRSEIDPTSLIAAVAAAGGRIAMPVIAERRMFFRLFDDESCLEDGVFGTRHPRADQPVVDPDFIVAPLAAFDRSGGRIGYGAGHYDCAVAGLAARNLPFRLAGIAFACQEVEAVPMEPHDVALPMVATEAELLRGVA